MSLINYKLHTKLNKSIVYVIVRITIVFYIAVTRTYLTSNQFTFQKF